MQEYCLLHWLPGKYQIGGVQGDGGGVYWDGVWVKHPPSAPVYCVDKLACVLLLNRDINILCLLWIINVYK